MKTLLLTRHAKSNWDNPNWQDIERPLNERGLRDAPYIAEVVSNLIEKPDLILSSPATRAITTARIFATAFDYDTDLIKIDSNIYENGAWYIIKLLTKLDNNLNRVFLFGHNPDMTSLYSYFSGDYMDNIPTCGSFCFDFDFGNWKELENVNGKLRFYEYPKKYFKKDINLFD